MTPCCINSEVMGDVSQDSMENIFHGESFRKLRETLLKGEVPESCLVCKNLEEQNVASMRQGVNLKFIKDAISVSLLADPSGKLPYYKPKSLDIRFSTLCNLKCRTCGPGYSSAWEKEEFSQSLTTVPSHLLEEVLNIIPLAEEVYLAGGEPLMMRENLTLLNQIKKNRPQSRVVYNTNLTSLNYFGVDYLELWKDVDNLLVVVSMDDVGAKGEYLRSGKNFQVFLENAKRLRETKKEMWFNTVVSAINIFSLEEIHEFFEREFPGVKTEYTLLTTPQHLRISVLPEEIRGELRQSLSLLKEKTKSEDLQACLNLALSELQEDRTGDLQTLINYLRLLDARRGESFTKVYPSHPLKSYF